ncbi:serine hydrolase domain-containing protein [Flocculibacter collagenilyticus]|uniref:hypothetical protein n=1 Tax=Flocculibacter collagenilyticus TaxID=2744479 RepID=UPI0018F455E2|nr:hypothetical protein [Flocculibacter collagenilyticus]
MQNIGVADAPLVTDAHDMVLLLKEIVNGMHVSEKIRALMLEKPSMYNVNAQLSYGLGVFKQNIDGTMVYHHGGEEPGYSSANIYIPQSDTSLTLLFNYGGFEACETRVDGVIQTVLKTFLQNK